MMNDLLGDWKARDTIQTHAGFSAFTLHLGAVVSVTQVDEGNKQVLVKIGTITVWKGKRFLDQFDQLASRNCQCVECKSEAPHDSCCAVHNEPATPNGDCDCRQ